MESCETCKFWKEPDSANMKDEGDGHCRRYPPTLDLNYIECSPESATEESVWYGQPITHAESWCGEFAKKHGIISE